jgi:hypothetical protein
MRAVPVRKNGRIPRPLRALAGALLGIVLATLTWIVGIERRGALATLGAVALLTGPGFLALGVALTYWLDGPGGPGSTRRLIAVLLGMAASVSNLLVLMLLASLFVGAYALLFACKLFVPVLAGGLGVGLGCQVGGGPRP